MSSYQPAPLVLIVPTRGRPASALRLQGPLDDSSVARVVFIVDEDDPSREEYEALGVDMLVAPQGRPGIVDPLNWGFKEVMSRLNPEMVAFLGDDHLPQGDWDVVIVETLRQMGTGMCYGNDLLQGERIPTAVFMTSDIPRTLGYMAPPELHHLFVDNYWLDLGRGIDRMKYLPDTIIEHLHPLNGKSEWDATYSHCNDSAAPKDGLIYRELITRGRIAEDVAKVRAIL